MKVAAKRVGVIGAGPAGLAVARVLATEPDSPFTVTVLERSNDVGGIWNYTPDSSVCHYNVPQDNAQNAVTRGYDERSTITGGFPTPVYDDLHTNLPKDVMQFPGFPFPEDVPDFPDRQQVQLYVHRYYDCPEHGLQGLVQLNSEVESAEWADGEWVCTVRRLTDSSDCLETLRFDALAVCTGRVSHPYIPQVPGLHELAERRPGVVVHAKEYRRATDYSGQTVLVVGGASSGSDISRQLSFTARQVHLSVRNSSVHDKLEPVLGAGVNKDNPPRRHPQIRSVDEEAVHFVDGSSIALPDHIIYATGYLPVYPFLQNNNNNNNNTQLANLLADGRSVRDLYKFLLYTQNPTLAIFGVPSKVVPFPLFEYQAAFLARVLRGAVELPTCEEMQREWDNAVLKAKESSSQLYEMGMRQIDYQNNLVDMIMEGPIRPPSRLGYVSEEWAQRRKHTFELRMRLLGY
ncbi:monooxygenase [Coemansia sp. BCRC 34490]|nr:monooxygenase [Coemansia sp. BCRC 34490]